MELVYYLLSEGHMEEAYDTLERSAIIFFYMVE